MTVNFYNLALSGIFQYPPTEDQLKVINPFYWAFDSSTLLWITRIVSLLFLIVSLWLWFRLIKKILNKKVALISTIVVAISPVFLVLWIAHPSDCLKILFVMIIAFFFSNNFKKKWMSVVLILVTIYLLFFSLLTSSERSAFFHKLTFADGQTETQLRFGAEDTLTNRLKIPLIIRRITYNKYYLAYKQLINEFIPFFDFETIFFQEVHPMEQKSVVLFYWSEIFLFLSGIYLLIKNKNKSLSKFVLLFVLIAWINYLFSIGQPYRRFEFILFPISILVALPISNILFNKSFWFNKFMVGVVVFFSAYGFVANMTDLNTRPDFWLDNRPLYFDFVYKTIKTTNIDSYKSIQVSSISGNAKLYCYYYMDSCKKFSFDSFDLSQSNPTKDTLYAGFVGEFVGPDFKNNIDKGWNEIITSKRINILKTTSLRDTIAYKYGNDIVVGEAR